MSSFVMVWPILSFRESYVAAGVRQKPEMGHFWHSAIIPSDGLPGDVVEL